MNSGSLPNAEAQAAPSGGGEANESDALVADFHKDALANVDNLMKVTAAFETPNKKILADGVDLYMTMLRSQEAVIRTMGSCKETMKTDDMTVLINDTKDKLFKMGGPKGKEFK